MLGDLYVAPHTQRDDTGMSPGKGYVSQNDQTRNSLFSIHRLCPQSSVELRKLRAFPFCRVSVVTHRKSVHLYSD